MNLIRFLLKHSPSTLIFSLVSGLIAGLSSAALLATINALLKSRALGRLASVAVFAALCLMLPLSRFVSELLLNQLGQSAVYALRLHLARQMLSAPLRHLEKLGAPRLIATLTEDVPAIMNAVLVIPLLCINSAAVLGGMVYLGILSRTLLCMVLCFLVIGVLMYQFPVLRAQRVLRLAREDADALLEHFRALTQGAKELKMHCRRRQAFLDEMLERTASSYRRHNTAAMNVYSAAASWGEALVFVVIGLILFLPPAVKPADAGVLTGYIIALLYLMTPLQVIMNSLPNLGRAGAALHKVEQLGFSLATEGADGCDYALAPAPGWRSLELRSVTHKYLRENETAVFTVGPLDLTFRPGELIFITGGNGSGKTTLAKLLVGLYLPESGDIRMGDRSIRTAQEREYYRQHFSVVFSDFYLFEQLLGLTAPNVDNRAMDYLRRLQLTDKVAIRDGHFSTIDLSQGQRKRLALLTSYLEDRPIYLFDEWAADQDPYFRDIFYLHLLPELKSRGKTVFVISHDDRYYHVADRLLKLESGQVISDAANRAPKFARV